MSLSHLYATRVSAYRLTGHPCSDKWIVGAPEEMGPAKETAEVISQQRRRYWSALNQRLHKQISTCETVINYGITSREKAYQTVVYNILPKGNINTILRGIQLTLFQTVAIASYYSDDVAMKIHLISRVIFLETNPWSQIT